MTKLINKLDNIEKKIIIDDEGDFASPNAGVNKNKTTRINQKINILLKNNGIYIGVTATPARLDLNNTFDNKTEKWIKFEPHGLYTATEVFFPIDIDDSKEFKLRFMPEAGDKPELLRMALANFIVNNSILNSSDNEKYCFLIHTSRAISDHSKDKKDANKYIDSLTNKNDNKHKRYWKEILNIIEEKIKDTDEKKIVFDFAYSNISNNTIEILNSENKNSTSISTTSLP